MSEKWCAKSRYALVTGMQLQQVLQFSPLQINFKVKEKMIQDDQYVYIYTYICIYIHIYICIKIEHINPSLKRSKLSNAKWHPEVVPRAWNTMRPIRPKPLMPILVACMEGVPQMCTSFKVFHGDFPKFIIGFEGECYLTMFKQIEREFNNDGSCVKNGNTSSEQHFDYITSLFGLFIFWHL